jgi:hypothetical protein
LHRFSSAKKFVDLHGLTLVGFASNVREYGNRQSLVRHSRFVIRPEVDEAFVRLTGRGAAGHEPTEFNREHPDHRAAKGRSIGFGAGSGQVRMR